MISEYKVSLSEIFNGVYLRKVFGTRRKEQCVYNNGLGRVCFLVSILFGNIFQPNFRSAEMFFDHPSEGVPVSVKRYY